MTERQPPAPLGDAEVHDLPSRAVDDTFRIFVGHCGEEPRSLLLVTDANGTFGMAVDIVRMMQLSAILPPTLVVGVGYPGAAELADTVEIRARDLTPTVSSRLSISGGADAFIGFLRDELLPWIGGRWPASLGDTTYFGHSLGGLFGTHVMLSEPTLFDHFIISSPSLWWNRGVMFDRERSRAAAHDDLVADVYFAIGSDETDEGRRREGANLPDGHPAKPAAVHLDMVDDMQRFVDALRGRAYPSCSITSTVFADEFHLTVAPIVLSHGLRHFAARAAG